MPHPSYSSAAESDPLAKSTQVPTTRRTRVYLIVALAAAVLAGAVLFVGTGEPAGTYVLTAKQSIPALGILNEDLFEPTPADPEAIPSGAISADSESALWKEAAISDKVAQYPLSKHSILETSDLTSESSSLASPLSPDERLVSVPATYAYSVAGGLRVGDRIDIYALGDSSAPVSQLLASDVEIAGVSLGQDQIGSVVSRQVSDAENGEQTSRTEGLPSDPIPGVYTLRVNSALVPRLSVVSQNGELFLALRGAGASDVPTPNTDMNGALCESPATAAGGPGPATGASGFCAGE